MMPATLTSGIQEELLIAFRSQHRGGDDLASKAQAVDGFCYTLAGLLVQRGVANNPSLTNLVTFQLKLGLYQDNHFCVISKQIRKHGQNHGDGNEADIANG
jgi:hypothetical protein